MAYALGIDVGTTRTAAAVASAGRAEIFTLGTDASAIPSVVMLRDDGGVLVGEAADRRTATDPDRTAREFKRRMGDPTPLVLGGVPVGAEALTGHVVRWVVGTVAERQGAAPDRVVLTHPAAWSAYKRDLLTEAARLAGVPDAVLLPEPQGAARHYASLDRVEEGTVIAVYDFGGGTFDAAVVRRTGGGFELLGVPEGLERLGGIDIDQAVFAHVDTVLSGAASSLDRTDEGNRAALLRLRADCRRAKEALSSDTDVAIPVLLPGVTTEVRLTRAELEAMVRPRLTETVDALRRAVRSAGLDESGVHRVLLVGGSSRMPLVADLVREQTGIAIALDADPKHAIALGAARWADELTGQPGIAGNAPSPDPAVAAAPVGGVVVATPPPVPPAPDPLPTPAWQPAPAAATAAGGNRGLLAVFVGLALLAVVVVVVAVVRSQSPAPPAATPTTVATSTAAGAPTSSAASGSGGTTPGAEGFVVVTDGTGRLQVEVPEGWSQHNTAQVVVNGVQADQIAASTDLNGYQTSFFVPGVTVTSAPTAQAGTPTQILASIGSSYGFDRDCTRSSSTAYDDGRLVGREQVWKDCSGTTTDLHLVVAVPEGSDRTVVVSVQAVDAGDLDAFQRALETVDPDVAG